MTFAVCLLATENVSGSADALRQLRAERLALLFENINQVTVALEHNDESLNAPESVIDALEAAGLTVASGAANPDAQLVITITSLEMNGTFFMTSRLEVRRKVRLENGKWTGYAVVYRAGENKSGSLSAPDAGDFEELSLAHIKIFASDLMKSRQASGLRSD